MLLEELQKIAEQAKNDKPESFQVMMQDIVGKEYKPLTDAPPYDLVLSEFELPFPLMPFQVKSVNELGTLQRAALYYDQGTGKTITSTAMALFKLISNLADRVVVIMPPILLDQWYRTLTAIDGVSAMVYRGTPAQRKKLEIGSVNFTLVGIQIFKRDFDRFQSAFDTDTFVILDEAHSIKNVSSDNHRKYQRFVSDKAHLLLTGTPVSTPEDGYAYIRLVAPGIYRNKTQFMNLHAGERDFFNQVVRWKNLDLLAENLTVNAHRVLKEDVLKDLPEITFTPMFYNLEPDHYRLYKQLAEEQLLILENGEGKIDATSSSKLFHALGQIVCNFDHFSGNPDKKSACFELLDQVLEELNGAKLLVFANYRMTNQALIAHLAKYNAVAAYGGQTPKQNLAAVERFKTDPDCKVFIAQPTTAGVGLDGLQDVCRDGVFLEIPSVRDFHQATARLHRSGQKNGVHIRIAVAEKTLQVRQQLGLFDKDALVNKVVRNARDLRAAVFGD